MSVILLFLLLLLMLFGLLLYLLKPTAIEKAVAEQLANIDADKPGTAERESILKQQSVRSTTVEDLARNLPWAETGAKLIRQAGKEWSFGSVSLVSAVAAALVYWVSTWFDTPTLIGVAIAVGAGVAPFVYLYVLREIRFRRFGDLLPEAVDLMSRGLRAGHSIAAVLEMVGNEIADPIGVEFRALHKEQSLGLPMRDAITNLIDRIPLDDLRFLATAILLQKESGGNLSQILDKTAAVLRERARLRGQLRIYTAQGRITGYILGAAPFLMFCLISLANHDYEKPLLNDPLGLKMVYVGLGLMVIGILAIRKIIDVQV